MSIWHESIDPAQPAVLEHINRLAEGTADEHLGVRVTEIGDDYLRGTVPVDERTRQPFGLLHGGVSVVLAESLGSIGANLCVDTRKRMCVGLDINANHLRPAREGIVTGTARPFRIGRTTQVWGIELRDEREQLTCVARLTVAVIPRPAR